MHRRLLSAAAAGALLLGLAACGEPNDGPVTTPPPNIDVSGPSDGGGEAEPSDGGGDQTTEPTAEAPNIPPPDPADYAGMDEHTAEGAEQAFRYYIAISIWAHQTGDTSLIPQLEGEECEGCEYLNDDISATKDSGLLWKQSGVTVAKISSTTAPNYEYEVRYLFALDSHSRPDSEFKKYVSVDSLKYDSIGGMVWESDRWIVKELAIQWGDGVY